MQSKFFTPFGLLLAVLICGGLFQRVDAQPKLLSISEYRYDLDSNAMVIADSIWYYRNTPRPYDTVLKYWPFDIKLRKYAGSGFLDGDTTYYSFDNNNNITQELYIETYGGDVDTMVRYTYTYSGTHLKATELRERVITDTLYPEWFLKYDYDGSGNLTNDIFLYNFLPGNDWVPQDSNVYFYTGNVKTAAISYHWVTGNPGSWRIDSRERYTYINGKPDTTFYYNAPTGSHNQVRVAHYNSQGDMDTSVTLKYWDNLDSYEHVDRNIFTYDTSHNQLTNIYQEWEDTVWVNRYEDSTTYTSFNLPRVAVTNLKWNESAQQFLPFTNSWAEPTLQRVHYYDTDDTASHVVSTIPMSGRLKVYPNPAGQQVIIDFEDSSQQPIPVTIYDAMGKAVMHWIDPPARSYHKAIDISRLPSGNYIIRMGVGTLAYQRLTVIH